MVAAARRRLGDRARSRSADLNDYAPPEPVAATTLFRALYYARDRGAFFRHVAGYTREEVRLRLQPAALRARARSGDLRGRRLRARRAAAVLRAAARRAAAPAPPLARAAEQVGPLARLVLRCRFTYVVSASRS